MKWTKRHQSSLSFILGFVLVLTAFWVRIANAEKEAFSLVKEYLNTEKVVIVEKKVQEKPAQPHTTEEQKIPIFVYHSVRPYTFGESKLQDLYDITPETFEEQLVYLRDHHYHVITTRDLFIDVKTNKVVTLVENPVMLTFDDGWKNQYEYAFPLLKKYNVAAVFYIYTQPLGAPVFLSWKEVLEMKDAGMVIGSHTLTHPFLKKISNEQLHDEIFDSKRILEKKLGVTIDDFASPYGYTDSRIDLVVKSAGYRTARTLYKSSYHKELLNLGGYLVRDDIKDFIAALEAKE